MLLRGFASGTSKKSAPFLFLPPQNGLPKSSSFCRNSCSQDDEAHPLEYYHMKLLTFLKFGLLYEYFGDGENRGL